MTPSIQFQTDGPQATPPIGCTMQNLSSSFFAIGSSPYAVISHNGNSSTYVTSSPHAGNRTCSQTSGFTPGYKEFLRAWKSSCSGDQRDAFRNFERAKTWAGYNTWAQNLSICTLGDSDVPEVSRSAAAEMLSFGHSPNCRSLWLDIGLGQEPCCGECAFEPTVVDLYYWPEQDVDDSCLSLVGNTVYPVDFRTSTTTASAAGVVTYWGCINPLDKRFTTTAILTSISRSLCQVPCYQAPRSRRPLRGQDPLKGQRRDIELDLRSS